jgi:hypothetical protein
MRVKSSGCPPTDPNYEFFFLWRTPSDGVNRVGKHHSVVADQASLSCWNLPKELRARRRVETPFRAAFGAAG